VQPEWDRCKICGADASGATAPPAPGNPPLPGASSSGPPAAPGAGADRPPVAAIVGIVAALLLLAAGGWWLMSGSSDDEDDAVVTATLGGPTDRPERSTTTASADDELVVEGFAAIMVAAIRGSGSEVDQGCVTAVASRPEYAPIIREVMAGRTEGDDARGTEFFQDIVTECIGIADFTADIVEATLGISRSSAECFGQQVENEPALAEAMMAGEDVEPTPENVALFTLCLTPAELEMLATRPPG
jgi:hypothetical protein